MPSEFSTSFSSLTLYAVNLLLWKKIISLTLFKTITISRPSTLQNFPYGEIKKSYQGKEIRGGGPHARLKVWTLPACWISLPVPLPSADHRPHIGKKVFLIAFRQILPKILPAADSFSDTVITNLKNFIENKSLNTKQYPAGLSPRIIPLNPYGKPWGWGKIPANNQKFTNLPLQENPFRLITLHKLHCSPCCCIILFII